MSQEPAKQNTSNSADAPPSCTRSSDYQPAPPEQQSFLSRLIVKIEFGVMAAAAIALGVRFHLAHREDHSPIKVAGSRSSLSMLTPLPAGSSDGTDSASSDGADPSKGQVLYMQTCTACHGQNLQGMPHQGISLRDSKFVAVTNDRQLVAFIKMGRKPADAKNSTGLLMPPRGGNPSLDDDALSHIVAFLRQAQHDSAPNTAQPQSDPSQQQTQGAAQPTSRPVVIIDQRPAVSTSD